MRPRLNLIVNAMIGSLYLLAVACAETSSPPSSPTTGISTETAASNSTATPTNEPVEAQFPAGIYFREPRLNNPAGRVVSIDGDEPVLGLQIPPGGFDLTPDMLVFPVDGDSLRIVSPDGRGRTVRASGLHAIARPSFSPDGSRVVVQAAETPGVEFGSLHIYVVDLASGSWERVSRLPYEANEESPEWFPESNRLAYSSFSPEHGVNLHIVDLDEPGRELVFPGSRAIHLDITPNGNFAMDPGRLRIYDTARGDLHADLSHLARQELEAAGYEIDLRFRGQADRGTFPLDGAFSPDAEWIVFDGAVHKDGEYGVIVARIHVDGSGFELLTGLIAANPEFANQHNYSQLNPVWIDES